MSTDQTGQGRDGQALNLEEEVDESKIPTMPMRAVSVPTPEPASSPAPDSDDSPTAPDLGRVGSKETPIQTTDHEVFQLPPEVASRVSAVQGSRKPNMAKVGVRVLGILLVLGAVLGGAFMLLR